MTPIYVDPFLGAGAVWLSLLDASLVPLVSWMGGKRRLSARILAALDLTPGRFLLGSRVGEVPPCLLGDASWWGWVWPVVLDPVLGPRVDARLRSWRVEDPRALWFRLRDLGPVTDDVAHAAAQMLWLQARAASGVPVWWEGAATWVLGADGWEYSGDAGELLAAPGDGREQQRAYERTPADLVSMDGHGRGPYRAWQMTGQAAVTEPPPEPGSSSGRPGSGADGVRRANGKGVHGGPGRTPRLLQEASTQIDDAGRRQAQDPRLMASDGRGDPRVTGQWTTREDRLVATTRGNQDPGAPFEAGHKGTDSRGGGGIVDPGTIAARAEQVRARLVKASGGEAGFGYDDGVRRGKGWRLFEPGDVAARAETIRNRAPAMRIEHRGALDLTREWAPKLGTSAIVYLDPPYQGKTGYPVACSRDEVLWIAETWARHGARVVLSEACGLAADLGSGWVQEQLPSARKPEWITVWAGRAAA